MMNKCIVLFVEGDTEVEFYKSVIADAKNYRKNKMFDVNIEIRNVKGISGFKNNALRKFTKEIKVHYKDDYKFVIFLCSDTDVFEFSTKPPINWNDVETSLYNAGASKVIQIKAKHSIEDWFLYDYNGILSFLRLPKKTKISGGSGYEKLKILFSKANKMYIKGMKSNGMISKLDIDVISTKIYDLLKPLYDELDVKK